VENAARQFYESDVPRGIPGQWRHPAEDLVITIISGWISERASQLDVLMDPGAGQLNPEYFVWVRKGPGFLVPGDADRG